MKTNETPFDGFDVKEKGVGNAPSNRARALFSMRQRAREVYKSSQRLFRDLDDELKTETGVLEDG